MHNPDERVRRLPRRAAVERAVRTLWPPGERDEIDAAVAMGIRCVAEMIHGDPIVVSPWEPDLSRLWDGVCLAVASELLARVGTPLG
jgi:hypothetical protein